MKRLGSAVLTFFLAAACAHVQTGSTVTVAPPPDCVTACQPFSTCRPDLPELGADCLWSCANGRRDADDRRTLAALTCPQVEALAGYAPQVSEPTPTALAGAKQAALGGEALVARPAVLEGTPLARFEITEIVVAPSRSDGTSWDGARTLDGPLTGMLEKALLAPDAAVRVAGLLRSKSFATFDPPDVTVAAWMERGGAALDEGIADRSKDSFVVGLPGALEARLAGGETLHLRLVDHDGVDEDLLGDFALSAAELAQAVSAGEATIDVRERSSGGVLFVTLRANTR